MFYYVTQCGSEKDAKFISDITTKNWLDTEYKKDDNGYCDIYVKMNEFDPTNETTNEWQETWSYITGILDALRNIDLYNETL